MVLITDAPAVGVVGLRGVAQRIAQGSTYFKILRFPRLPAPDDVVSDTIVFEIGPSSAGAACRSAPPIAGFGVECASFCGLRVVSQRRLAASRDSFCNLQIGKR